MNSGIVPVTSLPAQVTLKPLSVEEAAVLAQRVQASGRLVSAVGHGSTADLLSNLLGTPVLVNRISAQLEEGDEAIQFVPKARLPEGKILSRQELEEIGYELRLVTRTS